MPYAIPLFAKEYESCGHKSRSSTGEAKREKVREIRRTRTLSLIGDSENIHKCLRIDDSRNYDHSKLL